MLPALGSADRQAGVGRQLRGPWAGPHRAARRRHAADRHRQGGARAGRGDRSNPWWAIHDSDAGVVVLQFQDAKHLSVDTLDHRTGASAGRKTIAVDSEKLAPTWDGGLVWLDGASTLRAIDVATGRIAYHVP